MTIDAMGCQKAIARQSVEQEADDMLALKANPETWYEAGEQQFQIALPTPSEAAALQSYETETAAHGRVEIRRHWTLEVPTGFVHKEAWTQLRSLGMVEAERHLSGQVSIEQRYYMTSLDPDVKPFAHAVRAHWGIENCVHWVLDLAFREDEARIRVGHAPENFAVLCHIALNLLRQESTANVGIRNNRLKAGWDENSLAKLVFGHPF